MSEMIRSGISSPVKGTAEPLLNIKIGNCEYIVGVCFSKSNRDSLEDRLKRMIRKEVLTNKA